MAGRFFLVFGGIIVFETREEQGYVLTKLMARPKTRESADADSLNERQREILRLIIQQYVLTANPVGSRYISRISTLGLSDATLRNVMSDLEYLGFIDHPHTSAGRMPTDKGYRLYVDNLMPIENLSAAEKQAVAHSLGIGLTPEDVIRESTTLLAKLSKQLSLLLLPALEVGVLEKVEIVPLSGNRILMIIAASSGRVRTVTLETETTIERSKLDDLGYILNSRLAGKSFREVRNIFFESIRDLSEEDKSILRVFINSPEKFFEDTSSDRVKLSGAGNIFTQPEFQKKNSYNDDEFQSIIELIENEEVVIHVLEGSEKQTGLAIRIGSELGDERMTNYSIISTKYRIGDQHGTIAVIGPKRMDYGRVTPIVEYVAKAMSSALSGK
jgi:heat-inducible transcriptional repressor